MKTVNTLFLTSLFILCYCNDIAGENEDSYVGNIMKGISNKGLTMDRPYIAAGDRTYIIGTQDGMFPDMGGSHAVGEMAGLWLHPIKLMDGYWAKIGEVNKDDNDEWLTKADEFINYPYGNKHVYNNVLGDLYVERFQFCPEGELGMVVKYTINNNSSEDKKLTFTFAGKTELSPVWLSDVINIYSDYDTIYWDPINQQFTGFDKSNPWFLSVSSTAKNVEGITQGVELPQSTIGKGKPFAMECYFYIPAYESKTIKYIISGSYNNIEEAHEANTRIKTQSTKLLDEKISYYTDVIEQGKIIIPDKKLQEVYNWVKINTHWLIMDVPEIGRGLGAGFMVYPWWFGCDNTYAVQGCFVSGDHNIGISTLRLLQETSEKFNGSGQIIHEVTSKGVVFNAGNTQETAHFIMAVWKAFEWTGDEKFLNEMYPSIKQGVNWLMRNKDISLFPEGYGIMEVRGLNTGVIDVIIYTYKALESAIKIASFFEDRTLVEEYNQVAGDLRKKIDKKLWCEEESLYYDFYASKSEALRMIETLIRIEKLRSTRNEKIIDHYKNLRKELIDQPEESRGHFTQKNWVIVTPMETGFAPKDKAIRALDVIREKHTGEWGPYLSATEQRGAMTISTGVQAVAEAMYGRIDESLWYTNKIVETFSMALPGAISEGMPNRGCFAMAWTNYGVMVPLIRHIFGIQPNAYRKKINIIPNIPTGWKDMSIEELRIGNTRLTMKRYEKGEDIYYEFNSLDPEWSLNVQLPHKEGSEYVVNKRIVKPQIAENIAIFTLSGRSNTIKILK